MDMYNWLNDCLAEGSLDEDELKLSLLDDDKARELWEKYSRPCTDFIDLVRDEVKSVLKHINKKYKNL